MAELDEQTLFVQLFYKLSKAVKEFFFLCVVLFKNWQNQKETKQKEGEVGTSGCNQKSLWLFDVHLLMLSEISA